MSDSALSVLITGATGFVGGGLLSKLAGDDRFTCTVLGRRPPATEFARGRFVGIDNLAVDTLPASAMSGVDVVVHAAAQAHSPVESTLAALEALRAINVHAAAKLYRSAAAAGVKRFVFVSSIKVNGDETRPGRPFKPADTPAPQGYYAQTKLEAELALAGLAAEGGPDLVIVRPPLVYGPGVKGNFAQLVGLAKRGVPLPLGLASNRRTLIALPNLVDLLVRCLDHPAATGQVILAGDGEDLSMTELLRKLYLAFDKPALLLPVPVGLMLGVAGMLGQSARVQQLLGWLQADLSQTRSLLDWHPPISIEAALAQIASALPGR